MASEQVLGEAFTRVRETAQVDLTAEPGERVSFDQQTLSRLLGLYRANEHDAARIRQLWKEALDRGIAARDMVEATLLMALQARLIGRPGGTYIERDGKWVREDPAGEVVDEFLWL